MTFKQSIHLNWWQNPELTQPPAILHGEIEASTGQGIFQMPRKGFLDRFRIIGLIGVLMQAAQAALLVCLTTVQGVKNYFFAGHLLDSI